MNKKTYISPKVEIVNIKVENAILAASTSAPSLGYDENEVDGSYEQYSRPQRTSIWDD